ncbi:thioredoxin family protein [Nocardioides humi]|uniref:Thioredoxin 1 n=1 Tax=Nocardioides humi TaxID=449461 RepID=A0ABN2AFX5_9ACTN|nr:thioredoxin family protein [Nocardioides humi]
MRSATDRDFADLVLGAATPVLVCFHRGAPAADELDVLARDLPWLTCVRIDMDRWPRTAASYRVTEAPTLVLFQRGAPVLTLAAGQQPTLVRRTVEALAPRP